VNRPNVLYIMCDQFRFDCIAALGNPIVRTPNLDRLAARGAVFENAYSTCPVCVPARYTIRTGREPAVTGCYWNAVPEAMDGQAENMEARCGDYLARTMSRLGYRTFGVGKFHAHPDPYEDLGYEIQMHTEELWDTQECRMKDAYASFMHREHPEYDHIHQLHGERTNMYYVPQMSPFPPELTVEGFVAGKAVQQLEKDDKRPYFGFVSFVGPHPPCAPPAPYHMLYDPDDIPNPILGDPETDHMDEEIPTMNYSIWADGINDFGARNLRSRYLAEITYIDDCIGKILDAVEQRGDGDNTLIAFFSDHGDGLGDHHMWQKENYFEQATRVPFLVSWPGQITPGRRQDLVCLTDLFGLATAAAGAEEIRDGISLWNVLQGGEGREHLFAVHGKPGTLYFKCMVRMGDWKYIFMANGDREQLFNLKEDPMELVNRAQEGCGAFRRIAENECRRAGLRAALEDGHMRTFPFRQWSRNRIRQFDRSFGEYDFTTKRR